MIGFLRRRRRARLRAQPFPPQWRSAMQRNVAFYPHLDPAARTRLEELIKIFLAEKDFEGCDGLQLTDEIRVTIAAQACLLVLNRPEADFYPTLRTILVYPKGYVARAPQLRVPPQGMIVSESPQMRQGESWHMSTGWGAAAGGPVILSWDDARAGAFDPTDGRNLVFHEFAHQLDARDGHMNGSPLLDTKEQAAEWTRVMSLEFNTLRNAAHAGVPTILNKYGTMNPAEFFAVATEAYFERGPDLRAERPELWGVLNGYYRCGCGSEH